MHDRSLDECDCRCHADKNVRHIVACCAKCPWCRKRIRNSARATHVDACRDERKARVAETAKRAAMDPEEAWEASCEWLSLDLE